MSKLVQLSPPLPKSKLSLALEACQMFYHRDDVILWQHWWNWYWPGKGF